MTINKTSHSSHLHLLPSIVKGAGINFAGQAGNVALNAIFGLFVARFYGIKITGIFFLAFSIISFLQIIIKMGLHHAAVRYVSMYFNKDDESFRKYLQNIFFINFLLSVSISIIAYTTAPLIGSILNKPDVGELLRGLSIFLFLNCISQIMAASTRGTGKMTFSSIVLLIDAISRTAFFILASFLIKGNPVQIIWLSFLFGGTASLIASLVFVFKSFGNIFKNFSINIKAVSNLLQFSLPQGFADMVNNLYQVSPLYLLGYFSVSEDVGLLGAGVRITSLGTIFLLAFSTVFAPFISRLYYEKEFVKLKEIYRTLTYWIFGSSLIFFIFLLIYPVEFIGLFGSDFKTGGSMLAILTTGQIVNCITGSVSFMLTMSGKTKITLVNNIVALIFVIFLGMVLIPGYGVIGAAISYSTSIAFVNLLRSYEVYKIFGFHGFSTRMTNVFFAAALSGLFLTLIKFTIYSQNNINLILSVIAGFFIYLLSFLIFGLAREDFVILEATKKSLLRNIAND